MKNDITTGEYRYTIKDNAVTAVSFLLVGMGVGALLAMLLTPKSGPQMRKSIRRKYEDARDAVGEWTEQATEQAEELWERGADLATEAKKKVAPLTRKLRRS